MGLLEKIQDPKDLRSLTRDELKILAEEIRQDMIRVVAQNGGHLAPNLGVVELTLALHRVFSSPDDKIIWDVGHQSYIHKIVTGRFAQFPTLRTYQGLSGFPKREESLHDCFDTGHSSTSISAAVGFAKARDLRREKHHVVAVIGDGAMTGGIAYEAMNHAGHSETNLIVILNDNEMSISPNVGAMSSYLNRLRTDPQYDQRKDDLENLLKRIPGIGSKVAKAAEKAKDSLKYLLVPGLLFEELGFTYLGPIDGHDQAQVEKSLEQAKKKKGPVLVHVLTCKGKGYPPAEQNPDIFHGVGPFDAATGKVIKIPSPPAYTKVFGDTLCELAASDSRIVAVTAAMPSGTGLSSFAERFPTRFFDVGIAEQHAVIFASGLSFGGFKPVTAIYSTFLQRSFDQILHDVCLQKANVFLAIDRAGVVGEDGPTHHGIFDIAYLRMMPNLIFMAPKDENELKHMLYTGMALDGPVAIRYPRGAGIGVEIDKEGRQLPVGKGEVVIDGDDVTLISAGPQVYTCIAAAKELQKAGIKAAVLNLRFIKPLDRELIIQYAKSTERIITMEDHVLEGGLGSAVLEVLADEKLTNIAVERIGYPGFVEHGSVAKLHELYGLSVEGILAAAHRLKIIKNRNKVHFSSMRKV